MHCLALEADLPCARCFVFGSALRIHTRNRNMDLFFPNSHPMLGDRSLGLCTQAREDLLCLSKALWGCRDLSLNRRPSAPGQPSRASSRHEVSEEPQEATTVWGSVRLCGHRGDGQQLPGRSRAE